MWGPAALLVGKSEYFDVLLFVKLLCNMPLAHQAADLVSVSGVKGIEGNHPWRLQRHDLPPTPISHTVQFLWQTTGRRATQCIIASQLVSQPPTLTLVQQVLHTTTWCKMHYCIKHLKLGVSEDV